LRLSTCSKLAVFTDHPVNTIEPHKYSRSLSDENIGKRILLSVFPKNSSECVAFAKIVRRLDTSIPVFPDPTKCIGSEIYSGNPRLITMKRVYSSRKIGWMTIWLRRENQIDQQGNILTTRLTFGSNSPVSPMTKIVHSLGLIDHGGGASCVYEKPLFRFPELHRPTTI
jgi:hypothetical protein